MSHLWLPFTQMREYETRAHTFVRGERAWLWDADGRRIYDAISSVWTTIHGHCHPHIVQAIARQASVLDHATLLGAANPVAETLAERLCALAGMDRAFFASDGSSAVEAAIKMAVQYWQNAGEPQRNRFVRFTHAYHGDTVGAMSLSDIGDFKDRFAGVTFETRPYDANVLGDRDIAAVIVEPLVQGAAGMRLVPSEVYDALRGASALIICDEIATGFGRTGTMFAFEQTPLTPDFVCVGKGLTGGALALSATLAHRRIYEAFLGARSEQKHFFHGHSYAGNPIACAAALASLDLFDREETLSRAKKIAALAQRRLREIRALPGVLDVRQCGTMIGIEVDRDGWPIVDALYAAGHFTRPDRQRRAVRAAALFKRGRGRGVFRRTRRVAVYLDRITPILTRIREERRYRELPERQLPPDIIDFSSNDYLAMGKEPQVVQALKHATRAGSGGARLLSGRNRELSLLEEELAQWLGRERALLFSSGYTAAIGTIPVLGELTDTILSDRSNHASLIDGMRLTKKSRAIYDRATLADRTETAGALVVSETLFGMDGRVADVSALLNALREDDILLLDEAHALGVVGPQGAGFARDFADPRIVVLGTLSKALGTLGGFVAGPASVVELLVNRARSFIFDTALPPALALAARIALHLTREADDRRARLCENASQLRAMLSMANGEGPIVPFIVGDEEKALALSERLLQRRMYVPAIRPPTVAPGTSRLRISLRCDHRPEHVELLAAELQRCTATS